MALYLQPDRGTIFMEMQYIPFRAAGKAAAGNTPGAQKSNMTLGMSKKNLTNEHKGLLTVTLIRCIDLEVSMLLLGIARALLHSQHQHSVCCVHSH